MMLLKHKILKKVVLRRTKRGRAADLGLPPRIVSLRRDVLDIREQDYYESLYNESQAQFNTYVEAGTIMHNYGHIFDLLTRLCQAVDHPYLVVYSATSAMRNTNKVEIDNEERICGICHEPAENHVVTSCEHAFCKACLIDYAASLGQVSCPSCSTLLTVDLTAIANNGNQTSKTTIKGFRASSILNRVQLDNFQTSTKIEALVCIILINHVLSLNSLVHVTMFYVYLIGMLLRDLTSIHVYSLNKNTCHSFCHPGFIPLFWVFPSFSLDLLQAVFFVFVLLGVDDENSSTKLGLKNRSSVRE
ncbi:ATP-dependent helicase rhp16-like [Humulus lupulus]|uniref:ATP-dependent helicase rhp16-like n=1 Tax=Humulus lupulus TaxID=3486 RepID=UPI002B40FC34|nr:ATP-dependent helicase rhp16-like [Humulus lupulus]